MFAAPSGLPCRAAVQFEMSSYDDCIATCNSAVERGRELRADYKQVATLIRDMIVRGAKWQCSG